MSNTQKLRKQTQTLTVGAILTAFVVVLQMLANITGALLPTPITLVLIPIVIGAALYGVKMSAWLGFVFGLVVLLSGAANWFLSFSVFGTIVTVMVKCTACGFVTGIVYKLTKKLNKKLAIWVSAIVCPVVNTGVFIIGCYVFFLKDLTEFIAESSLGYANATAYIFLGLAGINFIIELVINMLLNPTIIFVLKSIKKQ